MEYTIKEISEFAKAASFDLGSNRYKPKELIPDYCKSITIIKQLINSDFPPHTVSDIRFHRVANSLIGELRESWTEEEVRGIIETILYKIEGE